MQENERLYDRLAPIVAWHLWARSQPIAGTLAERYLRDTLKLTGPLPDTLGYCHRAWCPTFQDYTPALITPLEDATGDPNIDAPAIIQTFLCPDTFGPWRAADGTPLAETFGRPGAGAARLAPCETTLGLAATVERALTAMEQFSLPVWATGAGRLSAASVPSEIEHLVIFADRDDWAEAEAGRAAVRGYRDIVPHVTIQHLSDLAAVAA